MYYMCSVNIKYVLFYYAYLKNYNKLYQFDQAPKRRLHVGACCEFIVVAVILNSNYLENPKSNGGVDCNLNIISA